MSARKRCLAGALFALCIAPGALADPRPTLHDFYDRTRTRAEGFSECLGYCDGERLAAFLLGAQVADPSTDAIEQAPAYGGRIGVDLGAFDGRYDVVRTKLYADFLRVAESGDSITDLAWDSTLFKTWGQPAQGGMHLSLNTLLAQRTELLLSDAAELQRSPYRLADAEVEVAPTGDRIDKDTFWALPLGVSSRTRWDFDGRQIEERSAASIAVAARGFSAGVLNQLRHHYQLDFGRLKRTNFRTPAGEAGAWTLSAGYHRLSPDVEWLQIWLLAGYEWVSGANRRHGVVAELGAEMSFEDDFGEIGLGPRFETHYVLDRLTLEFTRVQNIALSYRHRLGVLRFGAAYQTVALDDIATLHAVTPEVGVRIVGLDVGVRYRFALVRDDRFGGATDDRFSAGVDWLF